MAATPSRCGPESLRILGRCRRHRNRVRRPARSRHRTTPDLGLPHHELAGDVADRDRTSRAVYLPWADYGLDCPGAGTQAADAADLRWKLRGNDYCREAAISRSVLSAVPPAAEGNRGGLGAMHQLSQSRSGNLKLDFASNRSSAAETGIWDESPRSCALKVPWRSLARKTTGQRRRSASRPI